ncbi:hypothetical protein CYY_000556 [Polysphondylium violaceum]|uniref:Rhodanese domain-containing protein n=1 Tax=Polysphondylium violaceum TaxID=133409 RepID=A0A8J4Q3N3_9MYCE|nr:hypothetical protein CYY_000556 [Polysphondylium violaceum]
MANETNVLLLKEWLISTTPNGMLDLRLESDYSASHFPGSTNIPFGKLDVRLFELPPKGYTLGVLYGTSSSNADGGDSEHIENRIRSILENYNIGFMLNEAQIPSDIKQQYMTESGSKSTLLWKPCTYLSDSIELIESHLKQDSRSGVGGNRDGDKFNAIDIACGSGRDCLYLALRECWRVYGVDNDPILLNKMKEGADTYGCSQDIVDVVMDLETSTPPSALEDSEIQHDQVIQYIEKIEKDLLEKQPQQYDLVHVARYLYRPLFPALRNLVKPGGFILYHTFMVPSLGKPRRPRFLLKQNELKDIFEKEFDVLNYQETHLEDGRPIQVILCKKKIIK